MHFRDAAATASQELDAFHHFLVLVMLLILSFVGLVMLNMVFSQFIAKTLTSHHKLEAVWTVLPAIVLLAVAAPSLFLLYVFDSDVTHAGLTYKVTGHQWYWSYALTVPGTQVSVHEDSFMLPEESPLPGLFRLLDTSFALWFLKDEVSRVLITSDDVLHSWAVPSFGAKADACPGRLNEIAVHPTRVGVFYGHCSEICGSNHSYMPIQVTVCPSEGV